LNWNWHVFLTTGRKQDFELKSKYYVPKWRLEECIAPNEEISLPHHHNTEV
jgi:hypothetical protein